MDKQELDRKMKEAEQQIQQAQQLLEKLNRQKQTALSALEKKVDSLLDNTDKLTVPSLKGEEGPKVVANTLRELVASINSTLLIVDSQNQLIDMLINDLGATAEKLAQYTHGLLNTSMMSEVMFRTLLDKNVFSNEELQATHAKLMSAQQKQSEPVSAEKV